MLKTHAITRHSIRNYGSVLQAYATQELINSVGSTCTFVDYRQPGVSDTAKGFLGEVSGLQGRARAIAYRAYRHKDAKRRGEVFESFIKTHLELTKDTYSSHEALRAADWDHDATYCVGSDQVWNLEYNRDNRPYYLSFVNSGARKFSLASSIGMSVLPRDEEARMLAELGQFEAISVREADAADYLTRLGLDVEHHVDPTLGLDVRRWSTFAARQPHAEPYILVYQLNGNPVITETADALRNATGLPIKRVEYWKNFRGSRDEKVIRPTPQEFVGLLMNAELVLSDSFHGTAFSVNLGRPIVSILPPKYSSRVDSLLSLVGLEHRRVGTSDAAVDLFKNDPTPSARDGVLEKARGQLQSYLRRVYAV